MKHLVYIFPFIIVVLLSCNTGKKASTTSSSNLMSEREIIFAPGPAAIIYKTAKDYSKNVPVTMNAGKTKITSYPSPKDIFYQGKLAYPTLLKNGYLLDNRGININTAFLDYTYEEYSKLERTPSLEELESRIIDKHPFIEFWNCGIRNQYENEVKELNQLIDAGFPNCKSGIMTLTLPPNP